MVLTPSYLPVNPWIEQAQKHGIPLNNSGKFLQAAIPKRMKVYTHQIIDGLLATDAGRDKIFKIIQYSLKLFIWKNKFNPNINVLEWIPNLKKTASGLSTTRKCLILFAWRRAIPDLFNLLKQPSLPVSAPTLEKLKQKLTLFSSIIQIPNSILDDFYCFHRLGLVGNKIGTKAEKYGAICWWSDTFLQLQLSLINEINSRLHISKLQNRQDYFQQSLDDISKENNHNDHNLNHDVLNDETLGAYLRVEGDIRKAESNQSWSRLSAFKLLCDFIFVSYDVFNLKKGKEGTQAIVGLMAGCLSTLKLWDKHYNAISKAPTM